MIVSLCILSVAAAAVIIISISKIVPSEPEEDTTE